MMQTKKIGVKFLLVVLTAVLLFTNVVTLVMLLEKNEEWKSAVAEMDLYEANINAKE